MDEIQITDLSSRVLNAMRARNLKAKPITEFERYGLRRILLHFSEHEWIAYSKEAVWAFVLQERLRVTYIVQKYAEMAQELSTGMPTKISPHVFRHTKAMHLVQANVNPVYIKDYLGHADISTTEVYARADNEAKRAVLEKATAHLDLPKASHWEQDTELIDWLSSLG